MSVNKCVAALYAKARRNKCKHNKARHKAASAYQHLLCHAENSCLRTVSLRLRLHGSHLGPRLRFSGAPHGPVLSCTGPSGVANLLTRFSRVLPWHQLRSEHALWWGAAMYKTTPPQQNTPLSRRLLHRSAEFLKEGTKDSSCCHMLMIWSYLLQETITVGGVPERKRIEDQGRRTYG